VHHRLHFSTVSFFRAQTPSTGLLCTAGFADLAETDVARDAGPISRATQLSVRQLGMLSGFPHDYVWPDSRSLAGHIIGNAVCPPVMAWVVRRCLQALASVRKRYEEPTHIRTEPPRRGNAFRRALFALGLDQDCDGAAIVERARRVGAQVHRTHPTLVLRYTFGKSKATDANVLQLTQGHMQRGWTLEIRERGVANSQCDDLYWIVPQSGRYRSTAELKEAELF
jgi:hypothetical protein